jgi:integrase/recombinase XerD
MAKVHFYLIKDIDKKGNDDSFPIFLIYNYNNKRLKFFTDERIEEKHWDAKKEQVKRSQDGYIQINDYLSSLAEKVKQIEREFKIKNIIPTPQQIKELLKPKKEKDNQKDNDTHKQKFEKLFDNFVEKGKKAGFSNNRLRHYKVTRNKFIEFSEKYNFDYNLSEYSFKIHDKFLNFLSTDENNAHNTITTKVKVLKAFFNYLRKYEENIILHKDIQNIKSTFKESVKATLTWQEIQKLLNEDIKDKKLSTCRDIFLFACFTGMRFDDLKKLKPSHITKQGDYRVIKLVQGKFDKPNIITLNDYAIDILDKYENIEYFRNGTRYCFPVEINHKANKTLEELLKLMKFDDTIELIKYEKGVSYMADTPKYKAINWHNARHTYGVLSIERGMPLQVVQKQMGHSDIKTTQIYAKIADNFKNEQSTQAWKKGKD